MGLVVVSPPVEEPVSLADVKAYLRVDLLDEDQLIQSLITAAREYVELYTGRVLVTQTLRLTLNSFPVGESPIVLPRPRLQRVESVTYTDVDGLTQTMTGYIVDTTAEPGRLSHPPGSSWPDTNGQLNAVTIDYVAGYGFADDVPKAIKQAMMLLISHWYDQRAPVVVGKITSELPFAVSALLDSYRVWGFA